MRISRRQFVGLISAAGLSGCAKLGLDKVADKVKAIDVMPGAPGKLTFAVIGDIHVLDARSTSIVNKAASSINANPDVRFTVMCGDIATDGNWSELKLAKSSLDRLGQPYFAIPGNHDVCMKAKDIYANYRKQFDEAEWHTENEGWLFMGIDSTNEAKSDVSIRPDQIELIEQQLKRTNANRPIALFSHHPFNPNSKAYRVQNADELIGLFSGHNLKLVAAGHFHGNQEETRDGILFTTTACCSSTRDNHDGTTSKGYRLFHIENETITTKYVEVMA
ncbi:MAG: metallophosphoesterase [Candidatus Hydrogenedentes bacterium]|nr:metallophosphoesterase [Candidatus Hydrogenedentota bacterium]